MNKTTKGLNDRMIKNWKSSLLGLLLLIVACIALLIGKATLTEVGLFLPSALILIYTKDTIFKINTDENNK
jgi:hypothetical protein